MHTIRKEIISKDAKSKLLCVSKARNFDAGDTVLKKISISYMAVIEFQDTPP
jgi:hypothetical protein